MLYTSHSLAETEELAACFVSHLSQSDSLNNVFGFSGDLGSGKTAFTQCVARLLGVTEHITSPTFVIQKRYVLAPAAPSDTQKTFPFKTLIHIDAYRLESARELEVLDIKREMENKENLFIIEWPEKVQEVLPEDAQTLRFTFISEHVRTIEFPDMMTV